MGADAHSAASFYGSAHGGVACRLLRRRLLDVWPDLTRQRVLGLGVAGPYLRAWRGQASHCIAAGPVQIGATRWPLVAANLACAVEENALPFPDLFFDRVLLIHGLEAADSPRAMLREVWRVLKDDGRLLVVTPNRLGLWAHLESTPFGHGQPYSPGQIGRLLTAQMFQVERREFALYLPPTKHRVVLRSAQFWEQAGRAVMPQLGGVTITEAVKDAYAVVPLSGGRQRRRRLSEAAS
ncbi:MAG: methyltransferase domain-containing protein [Pseudomonadota bacterium]|nr:methyltransferase domain-containing protein [Pseudomonadota bacterium]